MTKKEMQYGRRTATVVVLIILIMAAAAALIFFGIIGIQVEKSVETASYNTKSEIKYALNFLDDPLYNKDNLEMGTGYVTKLINNVDLTFLYGFDCSEATEISGNYTATALLEATYNDSDLIWKKQYQVISHKSFSAGQARDNATLPLSEYIELAKTFQKNTGVNTTVNLTVNYTVNATALINGTQVAETNESTLLIPITGDVLVMGGNPVSEQSKTVETAVSQELLPKRAMLIGSSILLALLIGALIFVFLFTVGVRVDPVKLQLNNILKKYNGRIVEMRSGNLMADGETISLKSFKDLVLTADELKKPIFTNSSADFLNTEFYVFDKLKNYVFKTEYLKEISNKDAEQTPDNIHVLITKNSN